MLGQGLVAMAVLLVTSPALAWRGPLDILSLPADVDVAVSVRDAGQASRQASGKAARAMVEELAGHLGLPSAWGELWKSLDLPADEALNELLGRRVLIAWRWAEMREGRVAGQDVSEPDWVVLSLVSAETERRIRAKLRPAPREVHAGQAILALEDGRFLLTTRVLERGRGAIVMLAPAAHVGLFKDMLPRLGERATGPRLGDDPTLASLNGLLDADIAMLTLGPAYRAANGHAGATGHGTAHHVGSEATALGAWWRRGEDLEQRGAGLDGKLVRLGGTPMQPSESTGLACGQIDALAQDSLLAVADLIPRNSTPLSTNAIEAPIVGGQGAGELVPVVSSPSPSTQRPSGLAIPRGPSLASIVAGLTEMLDLTPDAATRAVGCETIAVLQGSGRQDDPLALTVGVSSNDLSSLAPSADRLMAWLLAAPVPEPARHASSDLKSDATRDPMAGPDFGGTYPPAVRVAEVPLESMARLGGLLGEKPVIAWQFAPMDGALVRAAPQRADGVVNVGAGARVGAHADAGAERASPWAVPGWWVVRLEQSPRQGGAPAELRQVSGVLSSACGPRNVVTAGIIKPAELLGAMAALGVPMPPAMGAMRWVSQVRWEGTATESGRVVVELSVNLNPSMGTEP